MENADARQGDTEFLMRNCSSGQTSNNDDESAAKLVKCDRESSDAKVRWTQPRKS